GGEQERVCDGQHIADVIRDDVVRELVCRRLRGGLDQIDGAVRGGHKPCCPVGDGYPSRVSCPIDMLPPGFFRQGAAQLPPPRQPLESLPSTTVTSAL